MGVVIIHAVLAHTDKKIRCQSRKCRYYEMKGRGGMEFLFTYFLFANFKRGDPLVVDSACVSHPSPPPRPVLVHFERSFEYLGVDLQMRHANRFFEHPG